LRKVELNSICRDIVAELNTAVSQAKIFLNKQVRITGQFDSDRISQLFTSLISNALLYVDSTASIKVTVGKVWDSTDQCSQFG